MKRLLLLLSVLFASIALAEPNGGCNFVTGSPHCMAYTGRTLVLGTQGPQNLYFKTNDISRGYFDGSTGALTAITLSAPNLLNNSYLTATNAAGSGTINILKIDASDDLIINSDASDVIKFQLESDANRLFTLAAASDTAHTLKWGDGSTADQTFSILASTADAADSGILVLGAGGTSAATRGAAVTIGGNESAGGNGFGSSVRLTTGDTTDARIINRLNEAGASWQVQNSSGGVVWSIAQTGGLSQNSTNGADLTMSKAATGLLVGEASRASAVTTATTLAVPLYISAAASGTDLAAFVGSGGAANGPVVDFFKTRAASGAATTIVNSADVLGQIRFLGANGTTYDPGVYIIAKVDGTPGASADMPGSLDFQMSPDGSATPASVLKLSADKSSLFTGTVRSSATSDIGWSVVSGANTACNTTCTSACVVGQETTSKAFLACTDATADVCLCAGAS